VKVGNGKGGGWVVDTYLKVSYNKDYYCDENINIP